MIKPFIGYVLVEPEKQTGETQTSTGLYLPESGQEKTSQGKVVAMSHWVGFNTKLGKAFDWKIDNQPMLKVGDMVIYKKWVNQEVKDEDKTYLLVKYEDLMAIVE